MGIDYTRLLSVVAAVALCAAVAYCTIAGSAIIMQPRVKHESVSVEAMQIIDLGNTFWQICNHGEVRITARRNGGDWFELEQEQCTLPFHTNGTPYVEKR